MKFKLGQQFLTINSYLGKIIEIKNKEITVYYPKDNSIETFIEQQFDSLESMIKRYNTRVGI
jgi:flagellar capping protein FliD